MNYEIVAIQDKSYVKCVSAETPISRESDALELISLCGSHDTELLMLHEAALSEDFFNLRTRLAGGVMQKLINYRVKTALILDEHITEGRFKELTSEMTKSRQFRIFDNSQDGEKWLLEQV